MKKLKKILVLSAIALVVLVVVGFIVVGFFLGDIVKTGVETVGPKVTQVSINVDKIGVSILTGSASVKGLVIGDPQGFTAPQAISVGEAAVGVNPFSVLSDKIVVREVHVLSPEITFEGNPLGNNNLSKILDNVNQFTQSGAPASTSTTAPAASKPAKKIEVDDFLISGAKVHYRGLTLPLPDIHLTDLGKGDDGITAADLTKRVLDAVLASTVKAIASSAADLGKGVGNLGQDAGKAVGSGVDKLKSGLGSLFGK